MFIFANFIEAIAVIIHYILQIYLYIIIARALISWVNPDPYNQIVQFLYKITEPVLYPIRRRLPITSYGIDFSPLIVLLIIFFLQEFFVKSLMQLAYNMH
ncbi:MAG: YggT family protein [Nitrospinae bacterium]|nr:YggT family protein [Nitrospinota bacterium]